MIDAVALGRQLLADPHWANKSRQGKDEEIRPCIGCNNGCVGRVFSGLPMTCAVNAEAFCNQYSANVPITKSKNILIVGGGVAGLEAARIAAKRGHKVTICEKSDRLGGALIPASVPEYKDADRRLIKWFERQIKEEGVKVKFNTEVTLEMLENSDADEIIISTGAVEKIPPIPGINGKNVITAINAFMDQSLIGDKAVVIGGGQVGCEMALWLKELGKEVTIIEAMPQLLTGSVEPMPLTTVLMLPDLLAYNKVDVKCGVRVKKIDEQGITISSADEEEMIPCDQVIIATGYKPEDILYREASTRIPKNIWRLGDANAPSNIMNAVRDGNAIGKLV